MKLTVRKFALMLALVMVFTASGSAFAWGNRTGSRTGDALVYGGAGGTIAAGVAYFVAGALCPPVAVAAGLGLLGAGAYGALCEEKTLATDAAALAICPVAGGIAAVKVPQAAEWTLGIGGGAVLSVPFTQATEAIAEEWKRPEENAPVNVADFR